MEHHHDHSHSHIHAHGMQDFSGAGKAFWISIGLNITYVIAEMAAGFVYNSMALVTDAGHNASDVASLLLSLLAFRLARKKPSKRFTYGYRKTTVLAALANAVILLVAVGGLGYETIRRFHEPYEVKGNIIAWVAAIGILINAASALLFFKNKEKDLNIKSAYLHLLADALVSVGVVVAGIVISFTGWHLLDPIIGLTVLIIILISTWSLLTDSFRLAVDAVPAGLDLDHIKQVIRSVPTVEQVEHVHIWAISTTQNALTAQVKLNDDLTLNERMQTIREIKHRLEHENIQHSTIEMLDTKKPEQCR